MSVQQAFEILSRFITVNLCELLEYVLMEKLALVEGVFPRLRAEFDNLRAHILEKESTNNSVQGSLLLDDCRLLPLVLLLLCGLRLILSAIVDRCCGGGKIFGIHSGIKVLRFRGIDNQLAQDMLRLVLVTTNSKLDTKFL
jgi:hypothetical protein